MEIRLRKEITRLLLPIIICRKCLYLPPEKIYTCKFGHNTCEKCFDKLLNKCCLVCESEIMLRNIQLEKITEHLLHKCPNEPCKDSYTKFRREDHLKECLHLPLKCPDSLCDWHGSFPKLIKHLSINNVRLTNHLIPLFNNRSTERTIHISEQSLINNYLLILANENIIMLTFQQEDAKFRITAVRYGKISQYLICARLIAYSENLQKSYELKIDIKPRYFRNDVITENRFTPSLSSMKEMGFMHEYENHLVVHLSFKKL
jgi:hypothetical protein